MGFFDSVFGDVMCPLCRSIEWREIQFKWSDNKQRVLEVGDRVDELARYRWMMGIASCVKCGTSEFKCKECGHEENQKSKMFQVKVHIDSDGTVKMLETIPEKDSSYFAVED